jgi:7-carboxy-7-deazaguanine synthase
MTLLINEVFGPTWQGEGPSAGRFCLFVRLALCNLTCKWCDTPYTWAFTQKLADAHMDGTVFDKAEEAHEMTVVQIIDELEKLWPIKEKPVLIVVSGGEPLMQQPGLVELFRELDYLGCDIQIETAGTIVPRDDLRVHVSQYNVSPKLANSGNLHAKRHKTVPLTWFSRSPVAYFKFVVADPGDLQEVDSIVERYEIPRDHVMIMPEGIETGAILDTAFAISKQVLDRGFGLTLRNHILIYGNRRGV